MTLNLNIMKKGLYEFYECFEIKMPLQLISIFGCDNKFPAIFKQPLINEQINGVQLKYQIKFQKQILI